MARQEDNRENLLREATALVERVEITIDGSTSVVAGFRRDGSASFFLDPNVVYHFNSHCQLRRAFLHGRLYKAESSRLIELARHRTESEVELLRHDLTLEESAQLLQTAGKRLRELRSIVANIEVRVVGQVPQNGRVVERTSAWLAALPDPIGVANSPRAG